MSKNSKSARTRGNTRPSSSGHSAELLSTAGVPPNPPCFIGFEIFIEDTSSQKKVEAKEEDGKKACPESLIRTIFKKMTKRDAVTRLKAVQEFIDFCCKDDHCVKNILPYWPRLFNRLALDPDKRVREFIHVANEHLVLKAKRNVAPYLKSFMGIWLITQGDPHAPAASAAQHAFSSSFPPKKQAEALMFCRSEILKMLRENLLSVQPKFSTEPNAQNEDANAEKYQFLLTCTLLGMKLFVSVLYQADRDKIQDDLVLIVDDELFWDYAKSKVVQVRRAWYRLVTTLCRDVPAVFLNKRNKLVISAMGCLSESDPLLAPAIWECALQITSTFEDWSSDIDVRRQVLPLLWTFLKHGGMGNAVKTFPCLLPFLSRLPKRILGKSEDFYREFFSSIRESFTRSGLKVPSECSAVVKGFMECLQYSVDFVFHNPECDESVVIEHLIAEQLVPLFQSSLKPQGSHMATSSFYELLGQYLQYIEYQALTERKLGKATQYNDLLSLFWKDVYLELINILGVEHKHNDNDVATLKLLFHSLYQPSKRISKWKKKVKFDLKSVDSDVNEISTTSTDMVSCQNEFPLPECSYLLRNTVELCGFLYHKLENSLCHFCIELFTEITFVGSSSKLYFDLLKVFDVPVQEISGAPDAFFEVVLKWAKRSSFDDISLDSIAKIIHSICSCVSMDFALHLLNICAKFQYQKVFCRLVVRALAFKNSQLFSKWFETPGFDCALKVMLMRLIEQLSIARTNISYPQITVYRETILKCISDGSSEESGIPRKNLDSVLDICVASLSNPVYIVNENLGAYSFLDLMCDICEQSFLHPMGKKKFKSLDTMVFRLFILSLEHKEYDLSEKHQRKLYDVWRAYIRSLSEGEIDWSENSFLFLASRHLHHLLQVPLSNEMRSHVEMVILNFLVEVQEVFCDKSVEPHFSVFSSMIEIVLPTLDEWEDLRKGLMFNTVPFILKRKWFYPVVSGNCSPVGPVALPQLITTAELASHILLNALFIDTQSKSAGVFKKELVRNLPHFLWSLCYVESVGYFRNRTEKELPVVHNLQKNIKDLAAYLEVCEVQELASNLFELSISDGLTWAIPFEKCLNLESPISSKEIETHIKLLAKRIQKVTVLNESLTMQVCLRNAPLRLSIRSINDVQVDCFWVEESSPPDEQDYFRALSDVSSSVQRLKSDELLLCKERIVSILHDLENYYRLFGSEEEDGLLFMVNFVAISSIAIREHHHILCCEMWHTIFDLVIVWFKHYSQIGGRLLRNTSALIFMHQICTLICIISHLFRGELHGLRENDSILLVKTKWHQLFNDVIASGIVVLYLQLSARIDENHDQLSEEGEMLVNILTQAIEFVSTEQLTRTLLPLQSDSASDVDSSVMTKTVYGLLEELTSFLKLKSLSLQFGIHSILSRIVVQIPKLLGSKNKANDNTDGDLIKYKTFPLAETLKYLNNFLEIILAEVKLGEHCILEPYTDAYTYAIAYLLTWSELLDYFSAFFSEERSLFACFLEEDKLLSSLLFNLFCILPENPFLCHEHLPKNCIVKTYERFGLFEVPPPTSSLVMPTQCHLQLLACSVFYSALRRVPALVRTWWNSLDKRSADIVEKFTSKHVSRRVTFAEMSPIRNGTIEFNNMKVTVHPQFGEVLAAYTVDDSTIELSVQLPSNYPLGTVVANHNRKMGIDESQWRTWMFQLTAFLNFHNGSLTDALTLWKRNLDKKFEGVEECMICYFILHNSTYLMPSESCPTCRKKFHSICLLHWFNTSGNTTCPGCRDQFFKN